MIYRYLFLQHLVLAVARTCSNCGKWGPLFVVLCRPLTAAEHGLQGMSASVTPRASSVVVAYGLQSSSSVVVVHQPSYSMTCGIFLDQGWKLCLLHCQVDSYPLSHQGSPLLVSFTSCPTDVTVWVVYIFLFTPSIFIN